MSSRARRTRHLTPRRKAREYGAIPMATQG